MLKKCAILVAAACFLCAGATLSFGADPGPADLLLKSEGEMKKPPAVFPHKAHQDAFGCGDCHHGMSADGAQVPYEDGQEIGKCTSCHNAEKLAGKTKGKLKLDTYKGAAHGNCLECHKAVAKKDESKKDLKKCATCHVK